MPEIVADKINHSSIPSSSALSYFHALCRHPIPGPLVGGSTAAKDVNKWLDDTIGGYESSVTEFQGGDAHKLLISLLKLLCQHYGKLRSPFGSDPSQEVFSILLDYLLPIFLFQQQFLAYFSKSSVIKIHYLG